MLILIYLGFSLSSSGYTCSTLLASSRGRILKLLCLLWFLQVTRLVTFFVSKSWGYSSTLWFLSCSQSMARFECTLPTGALWMQHLEEMWVESSECFPQACVSMREISGCGIPRGSWVDFLQSTVSRKTKSLICLFPNLLPPQVSGISLRTLGATGRKWVSPSAQLE